LYENHPGFINICIFVARKVSLAATSDKLPFVNEYEYDAVSETPGISPVPTPAIAPVPTPVSSVGYENPNLRRSSIISSASKTGASVDAEKKELKPSLAKPKEIPADYEGAEVVQSKVPKKEKRILFVGEEVIPDVQDADIDVEDERL